MIKSSNNLFVDERCLSVIREEEYEGSERSSLEVQRRNSFDRALETYGEMVFGQENNNIEEDGHIKMPNFADGKLSRVTFSDPVKHDE